VLRHATGFLHCRTQAPPGQDPPPQIHWLRGGGGGAMLIGNSAKVVSEILELFFFKLI
jgi:hypothetical protein